MILTIDIGNTNTVLGIYQKNELLAHWRISTDKDKTPDEYGILFKSLFYDYQIELSDIKSIIISSVVPPIVTVLQKTSVRYFDQEPLIVGPGIKTGLNIKVDDPREVGADRIVNAVAALQKYEAPLIIVDFGTATTFCALSENKEYLGGAISPGINISIEALFDYAAKLPRVELKPPPRAIGKNTVEGMQSGIIYGIIGQVEGVIGRFLKENDENSQVIATGGLVDLIAPRTSMIDIQDPFLTLDGLNYLCQLNR